MRVVIERFDGMKMIVCDDAIKDFEPADIDSPLTIIRFLDGTEVLVNMIYDDMYCKFNSMEWYYKVLNKTMGRE